MGNIGQFTHQYQLSKTLRFELIPQRETLRHIEERGILQRDEERAESYKKMKKTIDAYHKAFIDRALTGTKLTGLEKFYSLYTAPPKAGDSKEKKAWETKYEKCRASLRKEIVARFKAQPDFKELNGKELIQKRLEEWIGDSGLDLYFEPDFRNFTTYFTGYNTNRMNMYSDEEKATAVAHRLIDENFPKFIDNMAVYEKIKQSAVAENFPQLCEDMKSVLDGMSLDEFFSIGHYSDVLTQTKIDAYNLLLSGKREENTKIKGFNEYINLYNQTHPTGKLPQMKILYKQILSDREKLSWLPEAFGDVSELRETVLAFSSGIDEILKKLQVSLELISSCDTKKIFVHGNALGTISNALFGQYSILFTALNIQEDEETKKEKYYDLFTLQGALDHYSETADELSGYTKTCVADYFAKGLKPLNTNLDEAKDSIDPFLQIENGDTAFLNKNEKDALKEYLDGAMDILHFVKPLYIPADFTEEKDSVFYGAFSPVYEELLPLTKLYDMVRNFATKKPYSTEKIKLNFDCSTLMDGWDANKESQNLGILLLKDGKYYLGIMDKKSNKAFTDMDPSKEEDCYQKVMYKFFKDITTMIPKCTVSMKEVKAHFEKSNTDYVLTEKFIKPFSISRELFDLATVTYDGKKKFQIDYLRQTGDEDGYSYAVSKWIQFCMNFLRDYRSTANYDYESIFPLEQFRSISDFYSEVNKLLYAITYLPVSTRYVHSLVQAGKLYLFQIYNKDFSSYSRGKPNLHTMYWRALFDEDNLKDVVYKLNGQAEMFYRVRSIADKDKIVHPANQPIKKKNLKLAGQCSTFSYAITKDKRYTADKFQFHVPVTMNFKAGGNSRINEEVYNYLKNNPDVTILGIDRGERHLLYISLIDRNGHVVKDEEENYIQYSLNTITGNYRNSRGQTVEFKTPYQELLTKKEKERDEARKSWGTVENIKELKAGYLSQVVHHIAKLMVKYNAVVVMEDLNRGFKRGRFKVERQVYQNFEKALIEKLNYLVFKDIPANEPGGLYNALQLTEPFNGFKYLTKQCGFIFYIPAWNTSKIDPVTGFVDLLKPKYTSIPAAREFFGKFRRIAYNAQNDWFAFDFDYTDFTDKAKGSRTQWTICTHGNLRYTYNRALNNNKGGYEKINVTEHLTSLFAGYGIDYATGEDLREAICVQNSAPFFKSLVKDLQIVLAIRYSAKEDEKDFDFILSPVADKNGNFYCSEGRTDGLPQDADANGAFNIARKGLWVLEQIDRSEKYGDWSTKITNKEWLSFVQTRFE